jgi:hypothetical protein
VYFFYYFQTFDGGLAEWSIAAVLKTVDLHGSAGSNPVSSAIFWAFFKIWSNFSLFVYLDVVDFI